MMSRDELVIELAEGQRVPLGRILVNDVARDLKKRGPLWAETLLFECLVSHPSISDA